MTYSTLSPLAVVALLTTGCAAFEDPNESFRRPYQGIDNFGPLRSIASLPKGNSGEVFLGWVKQPNGKYANDDGTFERKIGSRGECVYAFKIDPSTGRIVSRLLKNSANDISRSVS